MCAKKSASKNKRLTYNVLMALLMASWIMLYNEDAFTEYVSHIIMKVIYIFVLVGIRCKTWDLYHPVMSETPLSHSLDEQEKLQDC